MREGEREKERDEDVRFIKQSVLHRQNFRSSYNKSIQFKKKFDYVGDSTFVLVRGYTMTDTNEHQGGCFFFYYYMYLTNNDVK